MRTTLYLLAIATCFGLAACSDTETDFPSGNDGENGSEWLIPRNEVRDGGPGKDGIPSIDNPSFTGVNEAGYLSNNDLVLGFADGNDIRAYPHKVLDWHEIVNDETPNQSVAVIYCPLTGTGIGWDRVIDDKKSTFGVSGLLYKSNIIPYDRATDSNWSQLLLKSVNGSLKGKLPVVHNLVETTWGTWKAMYPSSKVMSLNTGYNRNYQQYPYGAYKTNEVLLFPVGNTDSRLHSKERVLAVIEDNEAKAFRFERLQNNNNLFYDDFNDKKLVVAGSSEENLMVAFDRELTDGTLLEFQLSEKPLPALLIDSEGTIWDVFGRAIEGPKKGQKLKTVPQMMGYWFSFAAFYPDIKL